jgi:protein-S-isoprenylcysteine O-methyltransferase Ste14
MRPGWSLLFRYVAGTTAAAGLLFLSAGRLDYWEGWVYFGVNVGFVALRCLSLRRNPSLAAERLRPGRGVRWWDKGYLLLSTPLYLGALVVAGIDVGHRHLSHPPNIFLYAAALALFIIGQSLFLWAKTVNPFFSSVARIQSDRGQTVCRQGPYRLCRHPGYLGGLLFGLSTPIILGSYLAFIPQVLAAFLLVGRTFLEDRMLTRDLLWYSEYKRDVRFLIVPGLW